MIQERDATDVLELSCYTMVKSGQDVTSNNQLSSKEQPWWNRPITGEGGLLEDLFKSKEDLPESVVTLRNKQLLDLMVFAKTAIAIDSEKFNNEEFIAFVKIKYLLTKGIGDYEGLNESISLLQLAIRAKDSFIAIDQTELRYRGYKQQEVYSFVESLLSQPDQYEEFNIQITEKLRDALPQIRTDEGKRAMLAYGKHLNYLAENPLCLSLLSRFKRFQLADYSVLKIIAELLQGVEKFHTHDLNNITKIVNDHISEFRALKTIINLPDEKDDPRIYAIMIQCVALAHAHEISYLKFEELMKVLRKWYSNYKVLQKIAEEYPASRYKLPKEFLEAIPGEDILLKYQRWLTDKQTGMTYFEFD